jgi:restriction endonuclease S subunit
MDKNIKNPISIKALSTIIVHPPEYPRVYSETGTQLIRAQNVRPTGINLDENPVYFSEEFLRHKKTIKPCIGDLLMVRSGVNAGDAAVVESVNRDMIIGADTVLLKTDNISKSRYLQSYFATEHGKKRLSRYITGATNKHITPHNLGKILVEDLSEGVQKQIFEIFNEALISKENNERTALEELDSIELYLFNELGIIPPNKPRDILKTRIYDVNFTETVNKRLDAFYYQKYFKEIDLAILNCKYKAQVFKLRDTLSFIESGSRPSGGVKAIEEGILSFGGEHVNRFGQIEVKTPKYIPEKYHRQHRLTHTRINDVLIVKDGATTGKIGIIDKNEHVDQNINEHVFLLRFHSLNPSYATFLLNTSLFQQVLKRQITGATVTGLTKGALKSILIPVPNKDIQEILVNEILLKRKKAFEMLANAEKEFLKAKKKIERLILN